MNHKNTKLTLASKIMHILSFLSIIGILAMMTLNFFIKGHLHGDFEIGFNIKSKQVYIFSTLICIILISTILSNILSKLDSKRHKQHY
ncbi:hypothetical protein ACN9UU_06875 [Staphylococcus caprae]|uniref:Uncharacterized protein n=1 Tax=Staphylococcus caprae TaxID=29380 RepID=A0ABM7FRW7_9STAP|nr:hypothetical protein [Staphylococcus caprae]EES41182.1 hypothetical protein HMPREF0793_1106 [Staphylococcus caprae M23864:W1]MBN6826651.1 hypothetical protein [Staphylococcus caprae]MBX5317316.1 hypothetical protein [Staphylococcus caprae]MBX5323705.1 hypothetical protein [Staphylococcus caprae]MDI0015236.1 hypothetical protein [Staphylococcus caprae]